MSAPSRSTLRKSIFLLRNLLLSKIVVNFPFNGDIDTYAFPVPKELRADNHEHCWKSMNIYIIWPHVIK